MFHVLNMNVRVNNSSTQARKLWHTRYRRERKALTMNSYNPDLHRGLSGHHNDRRDDRRTHYVAPIQVRTLSSTNLFQRGEHEIGIAHGESLYRLKITRQGKLILNK